MHEYGPILTLVALIFVSLWVGHKAQNAVEKGAFLKQFFLGGGGLGAWALALTATVQSGGTFMGFPSLVYTHGWVVGLWISAYMVVPITGFGVIAKRMSQLSRRTGAITVPDLYRERFSSPAVGMVASVLILVFISFMMSAQFKAGGALMKVVWPGTRRAAEAEITPSPNATLSVTSTTSSADTSTTDTTSTSTPVTPTSDKSSWWSKLPQIDRPYVIGLLVFAITVVTYTMMGGFLAAVWTDLFQSLLMFAGVVILTVLALRAVPNLEEASRLAVSYTGPGYVTGPGHSAEGRQFLTPLMAASFFVLWIFGGLGQPASQVRLMACKDTDTIRRSMVLLASYNLCIYLPLVVICVIGRSLIPELTNSDEIIPRLTILLTKDLAAGGLIAGLILAAPFGAVMATVSSFLVIIASAFVRDVYQRVWRPEATDRELKRMTYLSMVIVGVACVLINIYPLRYLQVIIVFCSTGVAASFFIPALMVAFWPRATAEGMIASMITGALIIMGLLYVGINFPDQGLGPKTAFHSYYLGGLEPVVWGVLGSAIAGIGVSYLTKPPPPELMARLFQRERLDSR